MFDTVIADWNRLGSLVRQTRAELGWTQGELADRAGVSRAWVARLESGHRRAELEQILRLLAALDVRLLAQTGHSRGTAGEDDAEQRSTGMVPGLIAAESAVSQARSAAAVRRRRSWQSASQDAASGSPRSGSPRSGGRA